MTKVSSSVEQHSIPTTNSKSKGSARALKVSLVALSALSCLAAAATAIHFAEFIPFVIPFALPAIPVAVPVGLAVGVATLAILCVGLAIRHRRKVAADVARRSQNEQQQPQKPEEFTLTSKTEETATEVLPPPAPPAPPAPSATIATTAPSPSVEDHKITLRNAMKRIRADVEDEDQIDHSEETGKPEDSRFEEPPTPPAPGPYDNSRAGETPPFLAGIRNFKKKRLKPRKIPANGTHTEPKPSQVNGVSFNTGLLDKVHQNDRK